MIVALSDLREHDSPGEIGTSWRGEKHLQIAQTHKRACEPRKNHSLIRKTRLGVGRKREYTRSRWPLMFVGQSATKKSRLKWLYGMMPIPSMDNPNVNNALRSTTP